MNNTKIRILGFILAAAMLTGCGASAESDSMTESSQNDSSSVDSYTDSESKTDTTDDSKSDSSSDESKSEKAVTTTKTSESKNESEKAVTTTKQSSTTTSAVATQPAAAKATAKPVVTTKANQKPTVTAKQTTKASPKVTQATSKSVLPSNATPLRKALYEIMCCGKNIPANFKIVQQELIKYGKSLYPQYIVNPKLHGWVDNKGKYYDTTNNGQWTFLHYANAVDFYTTELIGYCPVDDYNSVLYAENKLKNYVKNQLYRFRGLEDPKDGCWYITIGMWSNNQCAEITCVCGFTFDEQWK